MNDTDEGIKYLFKAESFYTGKIIVKDMIALNVSDLKNTLYLFGYKLLECIAHE